MIGRPSRAQKSPVAHRTLGRPGIVGTRLSEEEMAALDAARGHLSRSAFLRRSILREINQGQEGGGESDPSGK